MCFKSMTPMQTPNCAMRLPAASGPNPSSKSGAPRYPSGRTDGERYLAHVLPLTSGARRLSGAVRSAAAAVFIRKAALDLPSPLETVAKLYRLTPAELRVLYAVMEAGGVSAISSMLGISEATVKTHIQHLFEKTGTRRQTDLVKLVAGHVAPIRT